jgi:hypothetical protein
MNILLVWIESIVPRQRIGIMMVVETYVEVEIKFKVKTNYVASHEQQGLDLR